MHKKRENSALIVGVFLIILGLINLYFHFINDIEILMLWYCDHIMILGGIAILLKNRYWLTALINVGLFPVLFWIIDYISQAFFKYNLLDIVTYLFEETNRALFLLYHQHLFIIPLMILALWFLGGAVKAWKGSLLYGSILILISLLANPVYNLNCVSRPCLMFLPSNFISIIIQFALMFIGILVTNWLLIKYIKK